MNYRYLLTGIIVFLTACSNGGRPTLDPTHEAGLLRDQTIEISGQSRNYHLYRPANLSSPSIVMLLHGNGGSSDQILGLEGTKAPYKVWLDIALQENLLLVVPDGLLGPNDKQGWNDCRNDAPTNSAVDDVAYLGELLSFVQSRYDAANVRVFIVGTSNGGFMAMRLAQEIPERLDGAAFVVASRPVNSECVDSTSPLPVLIMNGTEDPITPYAGGQIAGNRGEVFSTIDTVDYWVARNQTTTTPIEFNVPDRDTEDDSTIKRLSYGNGANNSVVEHYEVLNGGHTEPSIQERYGRIFKLIVGNQNGDLEMAEEIWAFFNTL